MTPATVIRLAPAVEFREELVGRPERAQAHDIGHFVELEFWQHDDGGWAIDIYGPEPGRTRRIILHSSVDLLDLGALAREDPA